MKDFSFTKGQIRMLSETLSGFAVAWSVASLVSPSSFAIVFSGLFISSWSFMISFKLARDL